MDKLCTIKEIAAWLGVSHHVVAGWIRDHGLYVRRRTGYRRYLCKSDVRRWMERIVIVSNRSKQTEGVRIERLYTDKAIHEITGLRLSSLRHWRQQTKVSRRQIGPIFRKIGGRVYYYLKDVKDFIKRNVIISGWGLQTRKARMGRLYTEKEIQELTGLKLSSLRNWRSQTSPILGQVGPVYCKIGSRVYYRFKDVLDWIDRMEYLDRQGPRHTLPLKTPYKPVPEGKSDYWRYCRARAVWAKTGFF